MSITPTPYESFPANSSVPKGAWSLWSLSRSAQCVVNSVSTSDYDIECDVVSPFNQTVYNPTLEANISVNLTNYGGATTLDFIWTYWPTYFIQSVSPQSYIPAHSQVGDVGFDDSFLPGSFEGDAAEDGYHAWDGTSRISHNGSTSVVRGSDPTIGYIALQMNVTMSTATVPNLTAPAIQEMYYWLQDLGFNITTPLQRSTPASPSVTTFPSSGSSSPSSSTTMPIGVIVGATVGTVVVITLIVIAFLFFRRQRERAKAQMANAITFSEPVNHKDPLPHEGDRPIQLPSVGPDPAHSAQPTPVGTVEPNNQLTTPWTEGIGSSTPSRGLLNKAGPSTCLVVGTTSGIETSGQHSSSDSNGLPPERPPNTSRPLSMHSSSFSAMPDYPPPLYGLEDSVQQDRTLPPSFTPEFAQISSTSRAPRPSSSPEPARLASTSATLPPLFSPELARFSSANRDVINENLEARLQAAGYLPTDDPSDLTPEQWRNEHGVTRLELNRLKNLYARNR